MTTRPLLHLLLLLALPPALAHAQPFPELKLLAGDGTENDLFGSSVARSADGTYALVGASADDANGVRAGAAYVFDRSGGAWTQQAKLTPGDFADEHQFGTTVALSDDGAVALVGARGDGDNGSFAGAAYVFVRTGRTWTQQAKLTASDGVASDEFGYAVALSGDGRTALVGSFRAEGAYVFEQSGGAWTETGKLTASDGAAGGGFGRQVALDGDGSYALVGAPTHVHGADAGAMYGFERTGSTWTETAEITDGGGTIRLGDHFALSADGRTALAGIADDFDPLTLFTGIVYAFERSGSAWTRTATLAASDGEGGDRFGGDVALSDDGAVALVGALDDAAGSAYVFERTGSTWAETAKLTASDGEVLSWFGIRVALDGAGASALVGASLDDNENGISAGAAYLYDLRPPPPPAPYVYTLGGTGFDEGTGVGVDALGHATFVGAFRGTVDFDPGAGTAAFTSAQTDVYVASYDPAGGLRFAFPIGNAFATSEAAGGIAVAPSGDFVVTGSQPFGGIDFDPDPARSELRTGELFVAGYDALGGFRFAVSPVGLSNAASGKGEAVALDGDGNAYVTGSFVDAIDVNPLTVGANVVLSSVGATDAFVASYDPAGGLLRWAVRLGGPGADEGLGIAADGDGDVYVTGRFSDTVAFDPDDTDGDGDREERTAGPGGSAFLAGYTADGLFRFAYAIGDDAVGEGLAVAEDGGSIYLTGTFTGVAAFDPEDADNNGDLGERTSDPGGSAFLARYTSFPLFGGVTIPLGGPSTGRAVAVNPGDGVTLTGAFGGAVDFDPSAGDGTLASGDGTDVFVASYDAVLAFQGAFAFGGDGLAAGLGVAVDHEDYILLTGTFTNTADVDPGAGTDDRASAGQTDLFLAKYLPLDESGVPFEDVADLELSITADETAVEVGTPVLFVVLVENDGPDDASGIEVTISRPAGLALDFVGPSAGSYDPATGVWSVPSLARTGRVTLTLDATVAAVGTHTLTATITARGTPDPDPSDDTASETVEGLAPEVIACTPDAPLSFSDYDAAPANGVGDDARGEFAELTNGSLALPVDLTGCRFVALDPFTERATYAAEAAGSVLPSGTFSFANVLGGPGRAIPAGTLPDGPGAFALVRGDVEAGDPIEDVLAADVVAAVVYLDDATVYGEIRGGAGASKERGDLLARLRAAADVPADLSVRTAPNPIGGTGTVSFGLADAAEVTVTLYDALGRRVAVLARGPYGVGRHAVALDASALPSGLYLVRVDGEGAARTARLVVVR